MGIPGRDARSRSRTQYCARCAVRAKAVGLVSTSCPECASDPFHTLSSKTKLDWMTIHQRCRSLHVRHFSVEKRHLEVLVNKNLLGAKIHDLVRLAERGFYLIGALPFLNLLRLGRRRLLLRLSDTTTLVAPLLVITITMAGDIAIAALSDTLIAGAVIDVQEFCNRIFHL